MATHVFAIPGIGGDATLFDLVAARLAPDILFNGFELPGYNGSDIAASQYGFGDLATTLAARADAAGIDRLHLLGHSIGGMVALEFALAFPERTASLVLSGTTSSFGSADGSFQKAFLEARLAPLGAGHTMAELAAASAPELVGSDAGPDVVERVQTALARVPAEAYRMAITCLVTFNRRGDMAKIMAPTILIAGEEDRNAPLRTMTRMSEEMRAARLAVLERTGHMAPHEKPIQFANLMRDFYREILPEESAA